MAGPMGPRLGLLPLCGLSSGVKHLAMTNPRTDSRHVSADAVVTAPAHVARARLTAALGRIGGGDGGGGPAGGIALAVGPRRHGAPTKLVNAELGDATERSSTYLQQLRWVPTGKVADWYPSLDGLVAITKVDENTSLLSIVARYVPPFGRAGAAIDRLAMARVADATVRVIADRLARAMSRGEQGDEQ